MPHLRTRFGNRRTVSPDAENRIRHSYTQVNARKGANGVSAMKGHTQNDRKALALRVFGALLATLLVACFQAAPFIDAYAADSKSKGEKTAATKTDAKSTDEKSADESKGSKSSKTDSKSLSAPDNKSTKDAKESEEKKRKKEAAEKRAAADSLYAQADAATASLAAAEAKCSEVAAELDDANAQLDETKVEYDEKTVEIERLQDNLSEYVVDMYKQGGATPYLDVMLGATSYQEFLTSWNMAVTVNEYGEKTVTEKKQLREAIETKLHECEERVKSAEKEKALADSNKRQINATRLAFLAQAAETSLAAAKLEKNDDAIESAQAALSRAQAELDQAIKEGLAGESLLSGTGYFTHPCPDATISSGFGYRSFDNAVHKGLDLAAPEGTPYYAADSGTVTAATNGGGDNGGAGNWIVIDHGNGLVTKYMHSLVTFVSPGDRVERGQNIGLVGNTGQSFGAHLHFQVEANGVAVNPVGYL